MKIFANLSGREKTFLFVCFSYILFFEFPLFADLTQIPPHFFCVCSTILLLLLYPNAFTSKATKWFFIFIAILLANVALGRHIHINGLSNDTLPALWRITIEVAWILPSILMMSILQKLDNPNLYRAIGYGSVIILTISFLYILPLLMTYSNILRAASTENNLEFTRPLGLPDYTLMHAYVLILPGLGMYMKKNVGYKKFISFFLIVLFCYVITQTSISTSITMGLLIVLFFIIHDDRNKQKSMFWGLIAVFAFLAAYQMGLVLAFVDWVMPFFEGTAVSFKLNDVHDSIVNRAIQGDSFEGRASLHKLSQMSFLENPIFGGGKAGGHSHVLDTLGTVGLVGFFPFFMTVWCIMRNYTNLVIKNDRIYMYLVFGISAVYLYNKGIFGSTGWLFMCVIAPSLVKTISNDRTLRTNSLGAGRFITL